MGFDVEALRRAVEAHGRVARVVIAEVKGSAPREVGAAMLVWDGGQAGTIGGGALELEAARAPAEGLRVMAKIRNNAPATPAVLFPAAGGLAHVQFDAPEYGVSAGQACVFYDGGRVLGGGWIAEAQSAAA